MDLYLYEFDSESGKELWKYQLPAGGHAKLGTRQGDYVLAFALP